MAKQVQSEAIEAIETSPLGQGEIRERPICLEQLVRDHLDEVACLAYRLLGWEDQSEDIVQDVFLTAAKKLKTVRQPDSTKAWLFTITVNKCRTYRYRQRLYWKYLFKMNRTEKTSGPASDFAAEHEKNVIVRQAVKSLPLRYREAVVLKYLEQLPTEIVKQILGINENTLNLRLMRARDLLRKKLKSFMEIL